MSFDYAETNDLGLWRILRRISLEFLSNVSKFYLYGIIGGSTLLFTNDNRVFAYGFNGNGRLGLGHYRLDVSREPEEIEQLRNLKIKSITGADFIVALIENDHNEKCYLLAWGSNNYGQLGTGDQEDRCCPIRIDYGTREFFICKVVISQTHVIIIDDKNRCWGWGDNRYGQVNGNITNIVYCVPQLIRIDNNDREKIINIACCETASLALNENGQLFIWGKLNNQLITRPTQIDLSLNNEIMIVEKILGMSKSFALLTNNSKLILIKQKINNSQFLMKNIEPLLPHKIVDIYGSLTYDTCNFIILCENNNCFIWNMIKSTLIQTSMTSIPDISTLHTCYYTNIFVKLPSRLLNDNQTINRLDTFNNEFESDLCIKTYTYTHFIRKIFVKKEKLMIHSEYLKEFCLNNIQIDNEEKCGHKIIIHNYSYLIVYAYMRYIYTKQLLIDKHCIAELYDLAIEFNDVQLQQLIPQFLYEQTELNLF